MKKKRKNIIILKNHFFILLIHISIILLIHISIIIKIFYFYYQIHYHKKGIIMRMIDREVFLYLILNIMIDEEFWIYCKHFT